ncbi:cytochrome P450 [Streptomyces sp. L-9-10]|uniref:cytochrome P450 n=1 Tax=Streptomyces sp. L-9-10 TaxID=1478131 RepID=UPI00101CAB45|nr:cytochrome P450 [Streptomyces sp. L-9-10]
MSFVGDIPHYPFSFRGDALASELGRFVVEESVTRVVTNAGARGWLVTGYAAAREALKDPRLSRSLIADPDMPQEDSSAPPLSVVGTMTMLRRAGLRDEAVKGMGPRQTHVSLERVRDIADTLLTTMKAKAAENGNASGNGSGRGNGKGNADESAEPGDLVVDFALPWASHVTCELLGLPTEAAPELAGWFRLLSTGEMADENLFADWTKALRRFDDWMTGIGTEGLLGRLALLNRSSGHPLSHQEMVEIALFLFVSGLGNPAGFLALCGLVLARDPELAARLRREPRALPGTLEELYRWSVMLGDSIARIAREDAEIGGVPVRAGELVLISIDAANRDPAVFDSPDRLDIDRRPSTPHLRFGQGRHFCPAAALNRAQTEVALRALLDTLPGLRLAVAPDRIRWRQDHAVLLPETIPVRW